MKIPILAAALILAAHTSVQNAQSMPGMTMPSAPNPGQPNHHHMPGMKMESSPQPQEHSMPGMDMQKTNPVSAAPPAFSKDFITRDTLNLQEPENPTHKTGSNLPTPDLLKQVIARPPMALQDFLSFADTTNPTIAQANTFVRRSAAQAVQAGLYPNPSVGYQGEQIRGGSFGGGEQGGYVQQSVVLGGKLGLRRNIYIQQKQSDQIGVEEQTFRVHNDVSQAFYAALTSQAMIVVRQRLTELALDAAETVHQLANVGQADAPDILQAEVEAEQAKVEFITAQRMFLQNFRILAAVSGKPDLEVRPLSGTLEAPPELDVDHHVAAIVISSPTVKRMEQEVAVSEARLRDAHREPIPDIQIKAGEQYNFQQVSNAPVKPTGPQSFASIGINLPLWNRNQGNISAAQAEIDRSRQEVARTQLALKRSAEPLAQSYQTARFTADRYRTELIPRAQRAYQLYLGKYQNMAMAYPQVLVSQRTLFQLQISYLAALHEEWSSAIALQNYTLSGGLEAATSTGSSSISINQPNPSSGAPE